MSATAATVGRIWAPVEANRRRIRTHTDLVRLALLRQNAGDVIARTFTRVAKCYDPCVTAKKLASAKHGGAGLGDTVALMMANPDAAVELGTWLLGTARSIAAASDECMTVALLRESRADSDEDVSQSELLADPDNTELLRRYLDTLDRAIAEGIKTRDAVARELAKRDAE